MSNFDLIEGLLGRPISPIENGNMEGLAWSIRNNLTVLLNSRSGLLSHLPDYGLTDLSSIYKDMPNTLKQLGYEITNVISLYEPRLTNVKVVYSESSDYDKFLATYLISGTIKDQFNECSIQFETTFNTEGFISMEII